MNAEEIAAAIAFVVSCASIAALRASLSGKIADYAKREIFSRFCSTYGFDGDYTDPGWTYEEMCDRLEATEKTGVMCA